MYNLTGGGSYCAGDSGLVITLSGSQLNVHYQLYINGNSSGNPVNGTGTAISFGYQTIAGTYSVKTVTSSTYCSTDMNNTVNISITTLPATPKADSASKIKLTQFNANWENVYDATDYLVDVATDNSFTNYVTGFKNLSVGMVLS